MIFAALNGGSIIDYAIYLVMTLVAVYIALVFHEVAHGLVAKWNGDYTAKYAGRLTLNPLKHFDLIGFLMMMLVGFGYAKPVPINPNNFKHYRRGLFAVAIAGVVTNLIIAFFATLFGALTYFGMARVTTSGAAYTLYYLGQFFSLLAHINLSLVFFNLLPIYPLDGFRVVESVTSYGNKFRRFMHTNGRYILYGLVALSFIVSMAGSYAALPYWFKYVDVLGTYLRVCTNSVSWVFASFWSLIFGNRATLLFYFVVLYGGLA